MMGDREAMRLIPQPLQQIEALTGPRQDHWFFDVGQPHFLQPLGKAAQGYVVDAELVESFRGRGHLSWATVYHHQRRRVRELPRRSRCRVDQQRALIGCGTLWQPVRRPPGHGGTIIDESPEAASDHFVDRGDVVLPVDLPDHEPPVLTLPWQ